MSGATKKCANQACEDGWLNLRDLTVPPRPCLDCNPSAGALAEHCDAKLKEFARWRDAPPREVIADLSSRLEAAQAERDAYKSALSEQMKRHAKKCRDDARSVRVVVRMLDTELESRCAEVATLTARLAESEKTATRYRRLFEGRCLDCNNLDPAHAPDCVQVAWEATR